MPTRSHWAWGYQERQYSADLRAAIAARLEAELSLRTVPVQPYPTPEDARLPPSRVAVPSLLDSFVTQDRLDRITHTYGRAFPDQLRAFEGDFGSAPDVVAFPKDEADLLALFAWASRDHLALIPYGGGTSVVGGVEAKVPSRYHGTVSVDLRAFNQVLEVDEVSRAARIQAGATGPELEAQLGQRGLTLRHYPQSFEFSTLGGWLATRSGGHFATGRTRIDDFVESIRMVTPRGVWQSPRLPSSGAGPGYNGLILGSEGSLGIITEAWMRVQPRPRFKLQASVRFSAFDKAVEACRTIIQQGLLPSSLRLLDAWEARLHQVVDDNSHVLLLAFESFDREVDEAMQRALALCFAHDGVDPNPPVRWEAGSAGGDDPTASWKSAFTQAPYLQSALISLGLVVDTFETCCTWDRFPALHRAVISGLRNAISRRCGRGYISCRFTHVYPDGPAPYYTFVTESAPNDSLERWMTLKKVASDILVTNGATITHHHAVGRMHRPWFDRERPLPYLFALEGAKKALDPAGILNPGVLIGS